MNNCSPNDLSGLLGIIAGVIVVLFIQLTIGNPFIFLNDIWDDYKYRRANKREKNERNGTY